MSKLTAQDLARFTGTTRYYRIGKQHLLTDGTHYLAEQAGCYWIMDAVSSQGLSKFSKEPSVTLI